MKVLIMDNDGWNMRFKGALSMFYMGFLYLFKPNKASMILMRMSIMTLEAAKKKMEEQHGRIKPETGSEGD